MSKTVTTTYEVRCPKRTIEALSWGDARDKAARFDEHSPACGPHHAYRVKTTTIVEAKRLPKKKATQ